MIPVLFNEDTTDYSTNGIGVLLDTIRCDISEEYNGAFDSELEYSVEGPYANDIKEGRQFLAKPNDVDEPHVFRIYEVEKILEEGLIFAKALSITNDLAGNLVLHAEADDATPQEALDQIKQNLIESTRFDLISDIETRSSSSWTRINPLQAIAGIEGSLVHYWGGDIKRTNNAVYLYSRRGRDNVVTIRPGKNIEGFNMTVSTKGVVTKILPHITYTPEELPEYEWVETYEGEYEKRRVVNTEHHRMDPITVVGEVVESENVDRYPVVHYKDIDYSSDEGLMDMINAFVDDRRREAEESEEIIDDSGFLDDLRDYVEEILNNKAKGYFTYEYPGVDEPNVEISVDMLQLSDSPEWEKYEALEHVQVSDTVDVYISKFDLDIELDISSVVYSSLSERVLSITAGSKSNSLFQQMTSESEEKTNKLEEYIETLENGVYNSISRTADGQSRRFSGYTEPDHSISTNGDMWFREVGEGQVELYIYDGGSWQEVLGDATVDQINQELDDAKQMAEDADGKAQNTVDSINNAVDGSGFTTLEGLIASKIGDDEFSTLYLQESKSIGFVYEVEGNTEAIIMIEEGIPYIKGEHIVLNGDTIVDGDFTVTEEMLAESAVINHLKATGIDAQDVSIINLDVGSISAGDIELDKGFRITHNGYPVLSVDANTGQVQITAPNLATKGELEDIELTPGPQGPKGDRGPQGIQGPDGASGTSQYIYIRYSANSNGNPMTTSPQSNSKYIGVANTTSSTAPSGYSSYSWALIKGEDGSPGQQGIQGPKGTDGQPTYTWVKYADTETGGGMDDSPDGKEYIGLAFNKDTPTESTSASQYTWSLMPQNIEIGGRNHFIRGNINDLAWSRDKLVQSSNYRGYSFPTPPNTDWTLYRTGTTNNRWRVYWFDHEPVVGSVPLNRAFRSDDEAANVVRNIKAPEDATWGFIYISNSPVEVPDIMLEKGTKATDWTEAPEDTQARIDEKAQSEDMDNLADIVSDIGSQMDDKAPLGELQQLLDEFDDRVAQDIIDKDKLSDDLATIEGRTALVEILAGDNKLITEFIDTVITESDEGIFIGNQKNETGVLISSERISFLDNDTEVAFISNQTMEISHGIFVESATISGFKFETIPGTEILSITWVGDE